MAEKCHPTPLPWTHDHFFKGMDWRAVRRGKEVYEQVFAPCHSLMFLKFRHFEAFMSPAEVKEMAAAFQVPDEDPDNEGNIVERTAKPRDDLPQPYANEKAARFANNGANPPDLSLITKAREGGCDFVYAFLTAFHRPPPAGVIISPGQYYNPYFPGGVCGMPPPLMDDMLEYEDGTEASVPQMAKDVTTFLFWCGEPFLEVKKQVVMKAIGTSVLIGIASGWYNRFLSAQFRSRRLTFRALRWVAK
eukprot:NODE_1554_length_851_cov_245.512469_g1208_i0.p1 GENE.NODE_1554_length_851_cov_245.512469_g1208_i0~~NODE_1554_length_851_cov_245.512469_g1208_i0.p1  ORF type:complete len:267 (-),score=81.28 NODE_1554_length_851_cov_245.512469_g1208_i0:49-789(-)